MMKDFFYIPQPRKLRQQAAGGYKKRTPPGKAGRFAYL
jgi:hypothetical protein